MIGKEDAPHKSYQNFRTVNAGRSYGAIEMPDSAPLVFPDLDEVARTQDPAKANKLKSRMAFVTDYYDKRAQASYVCPTYQPEFHCPSAPPLTRSDKNSCTRTRTNASTCPDPISHTASAIQPIPPSEAPGSRSSPVARFRQRPSAEPRGATRGSGWVVSRAENRSGRRGSRRRN